PNSEHYSTTNLVTSTPRVINVFVNMPSLYQNATDIAIARYNAESLDLTFQRVTSSSGADITIRASPWWYRFFGILGSAGFPTAGGDPHDEILMTRAFYDGVSNINGLATTIAHEMGHCIGFRHTDYADRSFSCGGATDNEGSGGVGAVYIPGTPTGPSANSWMLACGSPEGDRPFTSADITALTTLY
ncbi:MAG: M57 family metalloprotease, partial [Bacteroidota bacterium]